MKKMTPKLLCFLLALFTFCMQSIQAQCGPSQNIDQDFVNTALTPNFETGESFIAPCTGAIESIAIRVSNVTTAGTATMTVHAGDTGVNVIGTTTFSIPSAGGDVIATFATPISVTATSIYTYMVDLGTVVCRYPMGLGDPYPDGQNLRNIGGTFSVATNADADFRFIIGFVDQVNPTAVCTNFTAQLDATGNATITAADVDGGSTDDSGSVNLFVDNTTFNCSDIGDNMVTLTASDAAGNMSTCSAIVTVEDMIAPVISCPADVIVNSDPGICGAIVNDAPTATDNCNIFMNTISGLTFLGENQGKFFFASNAMMTAQEAFADAIVKGGFVATMEDASQNTFVRNSYSSLFDGSRYFIGYNDLSTEGSFEWQSGSTAIYTNWRPNEPSTSNSQNKDYVEVRALRRWQSTVGTTSRRYILELPAENIMIQTAGIVPGEEYPLGTTTNTFEAIDAQGNVSSCSYTVTVDSSIPSVYLDTGNLMITDNGGAEDNDISIVIDGSNYRIADANTILIAGTGTIQDCEEILVPIASVIGDIQVTTLDGDDNFTADLSGGNFTNAILYNGGDQTNGDSLIITGSGSFDSVTHTFINENDGSVAVTGNAAISYLGLEPIIDNLSATDRTFDFTGGAETITISDDATTNDDVSFIDSTLGESVTFVNPTNSLTINAGTGDDIVNVEGLDGIFNANLQINGDDDDDDINFQTNDTSLEDGDLTVTAEQIVITSVISTTGNVTSNSSDNTYINSGSVITTNGVINISGGTAPTAGLIYRGVDIRNGVVEATGTGSISINGTASNNGTNNDANGVFIRRFSEVKTQSGTLSITGNCPDAGDSLNIGVRINNPAFVETVDGAISITGTGGAGTGSLNIGIAVLFGALVEATGSGTIELTGTGGQGTANANYGIILQTGNLLSAGGGITCNAVGGTGTTGQIGMVVLRGSVVNDSANGDITITGIGGAGTDGNNGISINNTPASSVTTTNGDLTLNGFGSTIGTGNNSDGILLLAGAQLGSTGSGAVNLNGTAGSSAIMGIAEGVFVAGGSSVITNGGGINAVGVGGAGTGDSNRGIVVTGSSLLEDTAGGAIRLDGTAVSGRNTTRGIDIGGNATIKTSNGVISIEGQGGDGSFQNAEGIVLGPATVQDLNGGVITFTGTGGTTGGNIAQGVAFSNDARVISTSGAITLNGTSAASQFNAIDFDALNSGTVTQLETGGNIILNATTGEINTIPGATSAVLWQATNVTANGILAPGQSLGQVRITGAFALGINDTYEVEINDYTTAGDDYDQIVVTGTVNITDATLSLVDNTGIAEEECGMLVLIENDGADAIIGTFSGLPEGASVAFGGITGKVSYVGGDGNDFALLLDDTLPTVICQNIDVFLDASGNASITASDVDDGSTDACGIASTAIDVTNFTCTEVGPNNVTLTVTDTNGNVSTCVAVVTVIDNIAPIISCPTDITTGTDPGICGKMVTFTDAIASDACGIASITQTAGLPSGSIFPLGVSTVEFTATDTNGNDTVCSFTITVEDDEAPLAVCQDITIQLDGNGNATITAVDVSGVSTDNCGVVFTDINIDTFDCSNVGTNNVVLTVTDDAGNSSTCTAVVTVEDITTPEVVCQDITVSLDTTGSITIAPTDVVVSASDACGVASLSLDIDTFDCSNIGDNTVILTVTDVNGNSDTCTAIVTVEDNTTPDLVCMDITVELDENGEGVITPADVIASNDDACGILTTAVDITEFDCSDIGTPVTVQVFSQDASGNLASCMAVVTVVDALAPEVVCPADQTVDPGQGNLFYEIPDYYATGEATATDNCTDPLTIFSQDPAPGTLVPDGTYTITMSATDEYGNEGTCTFTLEVISVLGVEDNTLSLETLTLYPNPAQEFVVISNPQLVPLKKASVFDLNGRLVREFDLADVGTEKRIDVSLLPSARYLVYIQSEYGQVMKTLIKE